MQNKTLLLSNNTQIVLSVEWITDLMTDIASNNNPIDNSNEDYESSLWLDMNTPNLDDKLITYLDKNQLWEEIKDNCDNLDEIEEYLTSIIEDNLLTWFNKEESLPTWVERLNDQERQQQDKCTNCNHEDCMCCSIYHENRENFH